MRSRAGPIAIVAVLSFTGCGGDGGAGDPIAGEDLEQEISKDLEESRGVRPKAVECPDEVEAKDGTTFQCTVIAPDGSEVDGNGTVTEGGGFDFEVGTNVRRTTTAP